MSNEDDIILSELDDDELVQQMHDDLYDGLRTRSAKVFRSFSTAVGHHMMF